MFIYCAKETGMRLFRRKWRRWCFVISLFCTRECFFFARCFSCCIVLQSWLLVSMVANERHRLSDDVMMNTYRAHIIYSHDDERSTQIIICIWMDFALDSEKMRRNEKYRVSSSSHMTIPSECVQSSSYTYRCVTHIPFDIIIIQTIFPCASLWSYFHWATCTAPAHRMPRRRQPAVAAAAAAAASRESRTA